ncbi:hypothetical protein THAOC_20844 [Thalassiosira oceanica]|uniref:GH18 domain-containing protein n=1 Tax=Thalassiosira oceanica TaxID=159749 RepID=K0SDF4_THAOC|nr:hypothetical protein THAOC_20844 [Thalassiosira oceanica]|eukprot:EJK58991.1 hypothetical protein THAOC_20844 [Thalassiosira oceanica]
MKRRCVLLHLASLAVQTQITNAGYLSYVWAQFFTPALCRTSPNGAYVTWRDPDNWDAGCFDRTYDTPEQRSRMWKAFDTGVERDDKVDKILLSTVGTPHSDEPDKIENIGNPAHCPEDLMITIAEAHQRGIQVYALFSSECLGICEREGVSNTVQYNEICGDYFGEEVTFDGVAVNNESFNDVQSCNAGQLTRILDELQDAQDIAASGDLPLHFSLGWRWEECSLTWNGRRKKFTEHSMDIVQSIDVQVGFTLSHEMSARAQSFYDYWQSIRGFDELADSFYVLAYANPVETEGRECQISFAPHLEGALEPEAGPDICRCLVWDDRCDLTMAGMQNALQAVQSNPSLEGALGGIHYYGGVYATGITDGWPTINANYYFRDDPCSKDSDCFGGARCKYIDEANSYQKICGGAPNLFDPYNKLCMPKNFQCKSDKDCCSGDCKGANECSGLNWWQSAKCKAYWSIYPSVCT